VVGVFALAICAGPVFGHGGFHERMEQLAAAIEKDPTNGQLHFELADLNAQHGDWQLALLNLKRVDELTPGLYMTNVVRGEAWLVGEKPDKAKEVLDPVLKEHPECIRAWILRARASKALGDLPASAADFSEALQRTRNPEPDLILDTVEVLAAQKQEKAAAQLLATWIDKLGPIPSLVLRALDLEIATKDFDAALRRVEAMRQTAPRPEPWMARRASVLAQAGRIEESRAAWQALVDHLMALPNLERGSHAMSKIMEDAQQALASLASLPPATKSPTPLPPKP
jgi:predicted Zn-dependent protease